MNPKLAIIVPYRDREEHLAQFVPHMDKFLSNRDIPYKIFVVEQGNDRPFNRGWLVNIGYSIAKEQGFDYFCFHDSDLIPISDECDYSYEQKPISLVGMRNKIEFGDQEKIQNFNDYTLPYDEYFGGATLFSKEHFQEINGY